VKDREGYVSLVRGSMLQACAPHSKWADVFCDHGAFDVDESRAILTSARAAGLQLRVHGNQLGRTAGSPSRSKWTPRAWITARSSVTTTSINSVRQIRWLHCCGCGFLDARGLFVGAAPARPWRRRRPRDDCNPGTSYVTSMAFVLAIAVRDMRMDFDDALWSATRGGATALRRGDVGHLGPGARADVVILDAPRAAHLAYRPVRQLVRQVILAR